MNKLLLLTLLSFGMNAFAGNTSISKSPRFWNSNSFLGGTTGAGPDKLGNAFVGGTTGAGPDKLGNAFVGNTKGRF